MQQETNKYHNAKPLISIITVTFNAAKVLEQTLKSVFNQTYTNFEYIVIDGRSTDGTTEILKKYDDQITYWLSEPDNGIYDAMNKGVKYAKGEWIYFLGAGDILHNVFHQFVPKFQDANTVYYGNVYHKGVQKIYDGYFSPFKLAVVNICHQAIFYPAAIFNIYTYQEKYKVYADHVLNMNLYGDKRFKFKHIPIIICDYEGDGFSIRTDDAWYVNDKLSIIKSNFSTIVFAYTYVRRIIGRILK